MMYINLSGIVLSLYIPDINLSKPNNKIEKSVKNFSIFRTDNMFNTKTIFSYNYNIFILLCKNECIRIYLNIMTGKTFVNLGCYFPRHLLVNLLIQNEDRGWGKGEEKGWLVIIASYVFHFIRKHENLL